MSRKKLWRAWLTLYLRFKSSLWSKVQLYCILRNNYLTLNLDRSELFTGLCMLNLSSSCNKKKLFWPILLDNQHLYHIIILILQINTTG
jgi:hypothetical protein